MHRKTRIGVAILAFCLLASTANAAIISIGWRDDPGVQKKAMVPGETALIDFIVELSANESLMVAGFMNERVDGDNIRQIDAASKLPGWGDNSSSGILGLPADSGIGFTNVTFFALPANAVLGPGTFVVGHQVIELTAMTGTLPKELVFDTVFTDLFDVNGDPLPFTMGRGNPGVPGASDRDPLLVTKVIPEPTTLSLLALGGLAMFRRRRRR